jgi:hypothetical protein
MNSMTISSALFGEDGVVIAIVEGHRRFEERPDSGMVLLSFSESAASGDHLGGRQRYQIDSERILRGSQARQTGSVFDSPSLHRRAANRTALFRFRANPFLSAHFGEKHLTKGWTLPVRTVTKRRSLARLGWAIISRYSDSMMQSCIAASSVNRMQANVG